MTEKVRIVMSRTLFVPIVASLLLAGLQVRAHHPISEIYDDERTVILEGEVEAFLFGNPHSLLHLRVSDPDGTTRTWAVEWRAADRLARAGLDGTELTRGDAVVVCGHPGRDPAGYRLYLLNIARLGTLSALGSDARVRLCAEESAPTIADLTRPD